MSPIQLITRMIVASGLLYGYYHYFLRNRCFHGYNRFYLLIVAAASVIIPFLSIPLRLPVAPEHSDGLAKALRVIVFAGWNESEQGVGGAGGDTRWLTAQNLALGAYIAGLAVALVVFVRSLLYIFRIRKKYPSEQVDRIRLYDTVEPGAPFSFFRLVFWHRDIPFNTRRGQQIFRHELYHVQQRHSSDLVFMELLCCMAWFNPFFHLIKKELKVLHEFMADEHAVAQHSRLDYAELLLTQAIDRQKAGLSHPFAQQPIKRRIIMLTTHLPTQKNSYFSRAMVLPLLLVLLSAFALRPVHSRYPASHRATQPVLVVIDAGHGGIDPGAQAGGFTEKDIALALAQKVNELAPQYNVRVIMTRNTDELPGGTTDIIEGLRKRVIILRQGNADLFVSLHVNFSGSTQPSPTRGFEAYIARNSTDKKNDLLASALLQKLGSIYTVMPEIKQRNEKGIWVLDHNPKPAVLMECGNMSIPEDLAFITNKDNQEKIARGILEGIVQFSGS